VSGRRSPFDDVEREAVAMTILPCPSCDRAVKVFGKVRRVLCACGEVLFEQEEVSSSGGNDGRKNE
jgi:hypothetical protein